MEIKTYNKTQLAGLIASPEYGRMPVIPISGHRAVSHIHNPRAADGDVLMIIAYEHEEMIGYLGVLADRIYNTGGEHFKCGWLSCMWVNPVLRGKGIAKQLLATAFKTWDGHILVTEFTPEAKGLYDRSAGFNDLRENAGLRCYLRFNLHEVLPKKNPKYARWRTLLKITDAAGNLPVDLWHTLSKPKRPSSLSFQKVQEVNADLERYILSKQQNYFEKRGGAELNWILQYPWLKESPPTDESRRYHFSSVSDRFENLCYQIMKDGEIKGYLHFTIRDNHLKLPYAYFDNECTNDVIQEIYKIMSDYRLNMFTVFHPTLVKFFESNPTPFIYKRPVRRHYIISKVLDAHFTEKQKLIIQDGDADCAFT